MIINVFWWRNYFKNWVAFWKFPLYSQACKPWDPSAVHPGPFPAHRDKVDKCTPACAPLGVSPAPPAGILPRCAEGWDPLAPADGCGTKCVCQETHIAHCRLSVVLSCSQPPISAELCYRTFVLFVFHFILASSQHLNLFLLFWNGNTSEYYWGHMQKFQCVFILWLLFVAESNNLH